MEQINALDYADKIVRITSGFYENQHGALLGVIDRHGRANLMTIGWFHLGYMWQTPVAIVCVRPSRHSYACLEQVGQFTVNILDKRYADAIGLCGTKSGRDIDKFKDTHLTPVQSDTVRTPTVGESVLCLECHVIHYNDVIPGNLEHAVQQQFYAGQDYHRLYFGRIEKSCADLDALANIKPKAQQEM